MKQVCLFLLIVICTFTSSLAQENSRYKVISGQFSIKDTNILIQPAMTKLLYKRATYQTVTEQVLVSPMSKRWVKSKEKPRCCQGDCKVWTLADVAPQYKKVTKQVLKRPATIQFIAQPALYKKIQVAVVHTPSRVVKRKGSTTIYESVNDTIIYNIKQQKILVKDSIVEQIFVPPTFEVIEDSTLVTPYKSYWKRASKPNNCSGPIERCYVWAFKIFPTTYKKIRQKVLLEPASYITKLIEPAVYKEVTVVTLIQNNR